MIFKSKKGIALISVFIFMTLLVLAVASVMAIGISEVQAAKTQNNSTRALYVAEGGLHQAAYDLGNDTDWTDGVINGTAYVSTDVDSEGFYLLNYSVATKATLGGEFTVRLKNITGSTTEIWVKAIGGYDNGTRVVQAKIISYAGLGNPDGVTSPITAEGTVTVKGRSKIEPEEDINENAIFAFEDIFGLTLEDMREIAKNFNYYTTVFNSDNADVSQILTWVASSGTPAQITTAGWTGGGILVVEGNLKISGGVFNGVIWVEGELDMSGTPARINGAIFVKSSATIDTKLTGTSEIYYNSGNVTDAFDGLSGLPPDIELWREVGE